MIFHLTVFNDILKPLVLDVSFPASLQPMRIYYLCVCVMVKMFGTDSIWYSFPIL